MLYRQFGKNGPMVSALGFGCMRLPMKTEDGREVVDDQLAIPMLERAYEAGVNYFDTAWMYCNHDSQRAVGKALKGVREKVYLSTKLPMYLVNESDDFWKYLLASLERMDTGYVDFYHLHGLNRDIWENQVLKLGLLEKAEKAKAMGLIRHLSFSFHDDPSVLCEIADSGAFDTLLCQYNIMDRKNEKAMAYASEKGLGIAVMGPVGGGNLADGGENLLRLLGSKASSAPEMALRFVWGNPSVSVALSGMSTMEQLEQNLRYAGASDSIRPEEWQSLAAGIDELSKLDDLYCTGCDYCVDVCPQKIHPARAFNAYNKHHVWQLTATAKRKYLSALKDGSDPDNCIECGACSTRCPQHIDIPAQLKRVTPILKSL